MVWGKSRSKVKNKLGTKWNREQFKSCGNDLRTDTGAMVLAVSAQKEGEGCW